MASANVLQSVVESNPTEIEGVRLITGHACKYASAVISQDLLLVDFNQHRVRWPGLYLIEAMKDGQVEWRGCRRFDVMPSGIKVDVDGEGDWQPFVGHAADTWRIAGYVKEVYKPSSVRR